MLFQSSTQQKRRRATMSLQAALCAAQQINWTKIKDIMSSSSRHTSWLAPGVAKATFDHDGFIEHKTYLFNDLQSIVISVKLEMVVVIKWSISFQIVPTVCLRWFFLIVYANCYTINPVVHHCGLGLSGIDNTDSNCTYCMFTAAAGYNVHILFLMT